MDNAHRTWLSPRIEISASPIHGKGMFASSDFRKRETVLIWGDCYTDRAGAMKAREQGKGTMQWDDDIFSYETSENSDNYVINHSCDPNCWMIDAYTLTARRDIGTGEEITVDCALFGAEEDFVSSWDCRCGSALCRRKVTGRDWRDKELQQRYEGHFSPLINKRIQALKGTIE